MQVLTMALNIWNGLINIFHILNYLSAFRINDLLIGSPIN